jgi:hypothetical protein
LKLVFECCGVVAAAALLLSGCGLLISGILPWRLRPFRLLFAPFLGFALLTGFARTLSALGVTVPVIAWILVALAVAGWLVATARNGIAFDHRILAILPLCVLAFLVAVWPLWSVGRLTTLGATADAVSAASLTQRLELRPLSIADAGADLGHTGELYFIAILDVLTHHHPFELLTLVMSLLFALTSVAVYLWARIALRQPHATCLIAAGLATIHNLLLFAVLDNFLAQVAAMSSFPLLLACGIEGSRRPGWRSASVFGLLVGLVASLYPVFAAYGVLGVAAFWLAISLLPRPGRTMLRDLGWWLAVAGVALLSNGVSLLRAWGYLRYIGTLTQTGSLARVGLGDVLVYPSVYEVVGLTSHLAAEIFVRPWPLPRGTVSLLALGAGLAMAYGVWKLQRPARIAILVPLLAVVALTLFQRYGLNRPFGYPYGYFKTVSLVAVEAVGLLAAGTSALFRIRSLRVWMACLLVPLVGLNLLNCLWTSRFALAGTALSAPLLDAVEHAERTVGTDRLLLDLNGGLRETWVQSLWPHPGALVLRNAAVPSGPVTLCEWALVGRGLRRFSDDPWYADESSRTVWENSQYALRRRTDSVVGRLTLEETILRHGEALDVTIIERNLIARTPGARVMAELASGRLTALELWVFPLDDVPAHLSIQGKRELLLAPRPWRLRVPLGGDAPRPPVLLTNLGSSRLAVARIDAVDSIPAAGSAAVTMIGSDHGYATIRQTVALPRLEYRFVLWPPPTKESSLYRVGIHVAETLTFRQLGAWSLNVEGDTPHEGALTIDLASGAVWGEVDGKQVPVEGTVAFPRQATAALFRLTPAVWRLQPLQQIASAGFVTFERIDGPADHLVVLRSVLTTMVKPPTAP